VITNFVTTVLILGGIYALLALGLNLQLGHTGIINFGIVGYFAAGAYGYVILTAPPPGLLDYYRWGPGWPIWAGVLGGCALAVAVAAVTSWPCLRLRGDYLALMTFGFAQVIQVVLTNANPLTNGTLGFTNFAPPLSMQSGVNYPWVLSVMVMVCLVVVFFALRRIERSPYGRSLQMIRDDELATILAGKSSVRLRLQSFLIGGAVYGLAGVLFAWYNNNVNPSQFDILLTITVFVAVALGRFRSALGAVIGAFVLVALQQGVSQIGMQLSPAIGSRIGGVSISLEGAFLVVILRMSAKNTPLLPRWLRRSGDGQSGGLAKRFAPTAPEAVPGGVK
jgi:branched-chain amino acid transport system permease protein